MPRFHKNAEGKLAPCTATVRPCRYGESDHFDSIAEYQHKSIAAAAGNTVRDLDALNLINRERKLVAAAQREPQRVSSRSVASREEIYFNEDGHESGNGVVLTRFRDHSAQVRLPILFEDAPGEWVNVQLQVQKGTKVSEAFSNFLEGVEYVPPGTYRLVGSIDGDEVVTTLPTEHYARMRAALRTAEGILAEPLPQRATPDNSQLLKELMRKEADDD